MSFVKEKLVVRVTNLTIDKYKNLGYVCKIGDRLEISPIHAPRNNELKIELRCDDCGKIYKIGCESFCLTTDKTGFYICEKCKKVRLSNRKCSVCGGDHRVSMYRAYGDLLCSKHKTQIRKHGKILDRVLWDANEIVIHEDYAEFYTYDRYNNISGVFKIDLDMVDFVKTHKIHSHSDGYASYKNKGSKQNKRLHRYIMGLDEHSDMIVDHISGDKSDNRKTNLRITTSLVNNINIRGGYSHNTSGVVGVHICKNGKYVESYIHKNNKKISLYHGTSLEEAIRLREIGELEYFGEYSPRYLELIEKYKNENIEIGKYILEEFK